MAIFKYFKDLERKFAWSFLGVVLALVFGGLTVYREFLQDKRPALQFDILTSTSVLDVKEQLSNLSVLFDGADISKQGLSLRVITVRVLNPSSQDILKGQYDDEAPLGLHLSTGRVIRTDLVDASSNYLRDNLSVHTKDDQTLVFSSVILEAGESFTLKLLVLHPEGQVPILSYIGKIAGIRRVAIREAYRDVGKEPLFAKALKGGLVVQIVRLVAYVIGTILLIAGIMVPIGAASSKLSEKRRQKSVNDFKGITDVVLNESDEYVFSKYIQHGGTALLSMHSLTTDPDALLAAFTRYREHQAGALGDGTRRLDDRYEPTFVMGPWFHFDMIEGCVEAGLFEKTADGMKVDKHAANTLEHFVRFLKLRGQLPTKDDHTASGHERAVQGARQPKEADPKVPGGDH